MKKVITFIIIALFGISYSRAQFLTKPDADDLKQSYLPPAQNIDISQLLGKDWRKIEPYHGDEEEVWRFKKDTLTEFYYNYEYKEWRVFKHLYYLVTDTSYTYDDKDFDNSKVGKTKNGMCIVCRSTKNAKARPDYYRIIKLDMTKGTMELFRKSRWDEVGSWDGEDSGGAYFTLQIVK